MREKLIFILVCLSLAGRGLAGEEDDRWWPVQLVPRAVVRTTNQQSFPEPRLPLQMMVQSVAGLAAKAVNEGRGDELVWVDNGDRDLQQWYAGLRARRIGLETRQQFAPWDLVDHFAKQGLIKGYILYRSDKSPGPDSTWRPVIDCSVNVATSLAGVLDGIIVDEQLEPQAKAHGLSLLLDVRDKSQQWCFQTYSNRFSRRMLCFQDPRAPHVRDLAIAHDVFTTYGEEEPTESAVAWIEPLSPILGWNCGDEFANTDLFSGYGDFQTATDWSMNLPVLMVGSADFPSPKATRFDPRTIDWNDTRSVVAFVETDGDNVQWLEGNFFFNASYWANPSRGKIPFGWSCCFAQLWQLCPEALDYALDTRTPNDSFVEWGGGYYYPDRFARLRPDRWDLLARHARQTWELMRKTDTRMIGFNCMQFDSPDAREACNVFARQTDGLLAILVFQYSNYEEGAGRVFWVKDRNGTDIPVISARYSIWEHSNRRDRAGTPAKLAREIRQTLADPQRLPRFDWVIVHAWSWFKHAPGTDENAEDMPQDNAEADGGVRGYSPALWCAERLPAQARVASPEEMAWRIRMQHNPTQTRKLIGGP